MANSSDEDMSSDECIDLIPLWRDRPFLSDSTTDEDEGANVTDDIGSPRIELTPAITTEPDDMSPLETLMAEIRDMNREVTTPARPNRQTLLEPGSLPRSIGEQSNSTNTNPPQSTWTRVAPHRYSLTYAEDQSLLPAEDEERAPRRSQPFDDELRVPRRIQAFDEEPRARRIQPSFEEEVTPARRIPPYQDEVRPTRRIPLQSFDDDGRPIRRVLPFEDDVRPIRRVLPFYDDGRPTRRILPFEDEARPPRRIQQMEDEMRPPRIQIYDDEPRTRRIPAFDEERLPRRITQLRNAAAGLTPGPARWVPRWRQQLATVVSEQNTTENGPPDQPGFVLPAALEEKEKEYEVDEDTRAERAVFISEVIYSSLVGRGTTVPKNSATAKDRAYRRFKGNRKQ